jgi:hypothetical protein
MKLSKFTIYMCTALLCLPGIALFAQGDKSVDQEEMAKAMQQMQNAFQQMNKAGANTVVIGFREFKALLPAEIIGLSLHDAKGGTNGAMGMKISQASGEYGSSSEGPYINIEIMDTGSLKGIAGMSLAGWSAMEVDRESDTELEQTFTYNSYKAMKHYFFVEKTGEINMIIGARVVVAFKIHQIPLEKYETIMAQLDYARIEDLIAKAKKEETSK